MPAQKRTRSGDPKPQPKPPSQQPTTTPTTATPPCAQPQQAAPTTTHPTPKRMRTRANHKNTYVPHIRGPRPPPPQHTPEPRTRGPKPAKPTAIQKRPQLPPNATLTKRPLLRPAIPRPEAAAAAPKVLYVSAATPFVAACKRIRGLLAGIERRGTQAAGAGEGRGNRRGRGGSNSRGGGAQGLQANGRLDAAAVEASIALAAAAGKKGKGKGVDAGRGEEVYVKATGRAIPRALELGVKFQGESDCRVRVEMGNVQAIDDVEMGGDDGEDDEDVPETRIRMLSTVTVCIGLA
ncbi:Rpp20 subunit of nuclear RNase MRP and P-domain-containing protein [Boeremia exigua]|uniref:Rpp20 subunit of nuclear RNase MRP and P-domain-containing protein n=1 Tax=Boeremia exigua TaxID=749465 RepID=UPI001E8CF1BE|nr:Rpp20 subunit of nuclear RNase MRP and P-domain-containing protein [Boeremia exigua]KAH6620104.1 Rpp20 subunit of nuclear RNase MRP and P-domain-containing protein [Boeremia exigua]